MRKYLIILCLFVVSVAGAQEDTVCAEFVRERFHQGDLTTWLDAMNDHVVIEGLHTGLWDERSQLMFSVDGNSYRWNRFYLDGFRIDNRFQPGSTLYVPNLEHYDMRLDTHGSVLHFDSDTTAHDYASFSWNRGNLGGINKTTEDIIHIFHGTGTEGAYDHNLIGKRQYIRGAGTADVAYTIRDSKGRAFRQHLLATIGQQQYPNYDQNGLIPQQPLYPADAYKVQMDGHLPSGRWLDRLGYLINFSGSDNYGADFYLNRNEVCKLNTYSASLYAKRRGLTTGLTWSTNSTRHDNLNYSRNIIDQDGESMEPWSSDGLTHELSWFVGYERKLLSWLKLRADGYNSLLYFTPRQRQFSNFVYMQHMTNPAATPLYRYEWESNAFTSGLLENAVSVEASHSFSPKFKLGGVLGITLDGMLLHDKSKVMPNLLASLSFDYRPAKWFQLGLTLSHDRVSYNIEDLRYMSDDYLSANVFHSASNRFFTTTGGRYHRYAKHLQQPAYMTIDIPIRLRFGRHEIALLQTYKKFYHTWMTQFASPLPTSGYYDGDYFYLADRQCDYIVDYQPTNMMGSGFFNNTPYYMSQLSRYTYTGKKFMFSLSWQSMMCVGLSALGNGPSANNISVLSETTANPNTHATVQNAQGRYPAVGRLNQDKAYVCRIYLGYNVCKHFQFGITGRWTDGQPFLFYNTQLNTNTNGDQQLAIRPANTRGINPTDGNFGCRESAIFNIDIHARAQWCVKGHEMSLNLLCYNAYDFGNVLNEYCFPEGYCGADRGPNMTLTIPRGIRATLKIEL